MVVVGVALLHVSHTLLEGGCCYECNVVLDSFILVKVQWVKCARGRMQC